MNSRSSFAIRPYGTFRHLKASRREADPQERHLSIGGASVAVRADQVLDLSSVRHLFHSFFRGQGADAVVVWHDMTAMFHEGA